MLNKALLHTSIFLTLFLCAEQCVAASDLREKYDNIANVNEISKHISTITLDRIDDIEAGRLLDDAKMSAEIQEILSAEKNPQVLGMLAIISMTFSYGEVGDEAISNVYDMTFHHTIARLERIGGEEAIKVLQHMQMRGFLDAGYSIAVEEALRRMNNNIHRTP